MFNLLKKKNKNLVSPIAIDEKRIKTIPEKFLPASGSESSKYKLIIIIVGILIIIIGAFTGLLLFSDDFNKMIFGKDKVAENGSDINSSNVTEINKDASVVNGDDDIEEKIEEPKTAEIFRKEVLDEYGVLVGAIMFGMRSELKYMDLTATAFLPEKQIISDVDNNQFKIIGGVYSFEPGGVRLADGELLIKIIYDEQDLGNYKESDLKILNWEVEPEINLLAGNISELENLAELEVNVLPKGKIALGILIEDSDKIIDSDDVENGEVVAVGVLPNTEDSDGDGLTDSEETLYKMDASMPDTNENGLDDKAEVLSWYIPEFGQILNSNLEVYNSEEKEYSIYYPMSWSIKEIDGIVSFIADTGESVRISVQGNPSGLSARDWYLKQTSGVVANQIKSREINSLGVAWSLDQFTSYIANEKDIYLINYSVGLRDDVSFKATFDAMVNSFYFPKMFITSYSYENEEYGFALELPLSWENYDVLNLEKDWGNGLSSVSLMFRLPSETDACDPYDKCAVFTIDIFDFITWNDVRLLDNAPLLVNVNNDYVFAYYKRELNASDLEERVEEVDDIIETFVFSD